MRILEYDEVDGGQVLELNLTCFNWYLTPEQVQIIRCVDKHVPKYFALYAVEKEEVLSQVGVVAVDVQSVHGIEKLGFIWGVCTKPHAARKGYAKKLMEDAHARLLAEDIRYSFLGTGKSLVAYNVYRKLGYSDFIEFNLGMKACKHTQGGDIDVVYTHTTKADAFVELFTEYSNGLLGFVHRPKNFLQVRKAWSWMSLNVIGVFRENTKTIGYTLASKEGKNVRISELCCPRIEDTRRCIEALEMKFKPRYMRMDMMSRRCLVDAFEKSGFKHIDKSWGVLMMKDLKGKQTIVEIRKSYGTEEDRFQMTSVDTY